TRGDISRLLEGVRDTSGPIASNRLRSSLSSLWVWGLRSGRIDGESPVAYTQKLGQESERDRVLTDDELRLIWKCTSGGSDYGLIVRLLLLTGVRRSEVGGMCCSEV